MKLYEAICAALAIDASQRGLTPQDIAQLANSICEQIKAKPALQQVPIETIAHVLKLNIQVVLANNHSTARDIVQIISDDAPHTIPIPYQQPQYCPYPGLATYTENDSIYFYGRDSDIENVINLLDRSTIVISGPSGTGKSSLVYAGLVPRLRKQFGSTITILPVRLGSGLESLSALAAILEGVSDSNDKNILQHLQEQDNVLDDLIFRLDHSRLRQFLIILDQFEELFVGDEHVLERQRFLDNILYLDQKCRSNVTVIITTRENFFEHPEYQKRVRLRELIQRENFAISKMDEQQLRDIIEGPVLAFNQRYGQDVRIQSELIESIIDDFGHSSFPLPLMQYVLRLLWISKHHLTEKAYIRLGRIDHVLDRHATEIYRKFPEHDQPLVNRILLALVRPGLEREYTRRRAQQSHLWLPTDNVQDKQKIQAIVQRLSSSDIRVISEHRIDHHVYIELTHEVLLTQWTLLPLLIESHKRALVEREQLLAAAEQWITSCNDRRPEGDPSYLYHGSELKQAARYVANEQFSEVADVRILACLAASRQRRRRNIVSLVIALLLGFSLISSVVYTAETQRLQERGRANQLATAEALTRATAQAEAQRRAAAQAEAKLQQQEVRARILASQAEDIRANNPELLQQSVLLNIEAVQQVPYSIQDTYDSLRKGLTLLPARAASVKAKNLPNIASFRLADRYQIITNPSNLETVDLAGRRTTDHSIEQDIDENGRIIDLVTGTDKGWIDLGSEAVGPVKFSDDGQFVVASIGHYPITQGMVFDKGTAGVWRVEDGQKITELVHEMGYINAVAVSPNSKLIATASWDSTVKIWDVQNGREIAKLQHSKAVYNVTFSHDSRFVATASGDPIVSSSFHSVQVWEINDQKMVTEYRRMGGEIPWVGFESTGRYVIGASVIVDIQTGKVVKELLNDVLAISPDGQYLATKRQFWRLTGNNQVALEGHPIELGSSPMGIFDSQSNFFASASQISIDDRTTKVYDVETGDLVYQISGDRHISPIAFSSDGNILVTCCHKDVVEYWMMSNHRHNAKEFIFSPSGRYIASIGFNEQVNIWDDQIEQAVLFQDVKNIAFSSREKYVAVLYNGGRLEVLDLEKGSLVFKTDTKVNGVSIVFNKHDDVIMIVGRNYLELWQIKNNKSLRFPHENLEVNQASFCNTNDQIVINKMNGDIEVYSIYGDITQSYKHEDILATDVSKCYIVTGDRNGYMLRSIIENVMLYQISEVEIEDIQIKYPYVIVRKKDILNITDLESRKERVVSPSSYSDISGDGNYLLENSSSQFRGLVSIRRIETESEELFIDFLRGQVNFDVHFSPGNKYVVVKPEEYLQSSMLIPWRIEDLIGVACSRIDRNFTNEEWEQYFPSQDYHKTCSNLP